MLGLDAQKLEVIGRGDEVLEQALSIGIGPVVINAWQEKAGGILVLYPYGGSGRTLFPCGYRPAALVQVINGWLEKLEYPEPPKTDGSKSKGYSVKMTFDGVEISGAWMVYPK